MIKRSKGNKKVRNATPTSVKRNGTTIKFRSKLEKYCFEQLELAGIQAKYEPVALELMPKFRYGEPGNEEAVRKITYTPDFIIPSGIIECKGFANDAFPIKWKILKWCLYMKKKKTKLYIVKNQTQVRELIKQIKNEQVHKLSPNN